MAKVSGGLSQGHIFCKHFLVFAKLKNVFNFIKKYELCQARPLGNLEKNWMIFKIGGIVTELKEKCSDQNEM